MIIIMIIIITILSCEKDPGVGWQRLAAGRGAHREIYHNH